MMLWRRERRRYEARIAELEGQCAALRRSEQEAERRQREAETKADRLSAMVRDQNDADLYWAARKVMKEADSSQRPAVAFDLMANAMAAAQQRHMIASSPLQGFAGLFPRGLIG